MIPHQPITLGSDGRLVADRKTVDHVAIVVGFLPDGPPRDLSFGHEFTKDAVLGARSGQHSDESTLVLVKVGHVFAGGQLAVGHVQKIASAGQLAKQFPGVAVGLVIGDVAVGRAKVQGHAAVRRDGEDEQQLLQVGTMVLVVTEGDGQGGMPEKALLDGGAGVRAAERDRGRVVVQFVEANAELLDHMGSDGQDQRRHVGQEEPIQGPAHAVVVESSDFFGCQPQEIGGMACGPFAHAVDRLARHQQVAQQDHQRLDGRELHAAVFRRQRGAQKLFQSHPSEHVIEDRQRADRVGAERGFGRPRDRHGRRRRLGVRTFCRTMGSLGHDVELLVGVNVKRFVLRRTAGIRPDRARVIHHTRRKCLVAQNVKRQETGNVPWNVVCLPSIGGKKSCGPVFAEPRRNVQAVSGRRKGSSVYFRRASKTHDLHALRHWSQDFSERSCGHLPAWEVTAKNTTSLIAHGHRRTVAGMQQAIRFHLAPINRSLPWTLARVSRKIFREN